MARTFLTLGAFFAALAVAAGAFGSHTLKATLSPDLLAVFETGVRYQMYHALALLLVGVVAGPTPTSWFRWAGWLFVAGTLLFSGSLYVLSLTGLRWLGAVTPLGGVAFLVAWALVGWGVSKRSTEA